LASLSTLI
jgi:hypothetical protein